MKDAPWGRDISICSEHLTGNVRISARHCYDELLRRYFDAVVVYAKGQERETSESPVSIFALGSALIVPQRFLACSFAHFMPNPVVIWGMESAEFTTIGLVPRGRPSGVSPSSPKCC